VWRVGYGTQSALVWASSAREAVSLVRDRLDRQYRRRGLVLLGAEDFACRVATRSEVALMADSDASRRDRGVLGL
jgi:hypothetical protein